jgi:hypothetical protein
MFALAIKTDNAAFAGDGSNDFAERQQCERDEVARILRDVAEKLDQGTDAGPVRDINGNTVGSWRLR